MRLSTLDNVGWAGLATSVPICHNIWGLSTLVSQSEVWNERWPAHRAGHLCISFPSSKGMDL